MSSEDPTSNKRPRKLGLWFAALRAVWHDISDKHLSLIAAGVAFFGMLAIFPAFAAMIAIWGLVSDPVDLQAQLATLKGVVPADAYQLLASQLAALILARGDTLGWAGAFSLAFALWSTRAGVSALMQGLNAVYDATPRSGLRHYFDAAILTIVLISVALVALCCVVVAPIILAAIPFDGATVFIADLIRWTIVIGISVLALGILYRYGPNREHGRQAWFAPGTIFTLVLWVICSAAFSIYLSRFSNYNEVYGSIGAAIALLMWFYIGAFLVLLGAGLNVHLERGGAKDISEDDAL